MNTAVIVDPPDVMLNLKNKSHLKILDFFSSCLTVEFARSIEARRYVVNEYVIRIAPTGDAPTTSEWTIISSPTKVRRISKFWR